MTLKAKIDAALATLKQRQGDADYATWLANLETIAKEGFEGPQADAAAAATKVDALVKSVTRPKPVEPPPPLKGAFEVCLPDPTKPSDQGIGWQEIIFDVTGDIIPVPSDQIKLKADIETTLTTLQAILPDKNDEARPKTMTPAQHRYAAYQTKLLGIAQTGLQTPADPASSRQWLETLQSEILMREGPRIKNGYMKTLGLTAAVLAAAAAIIYLVLRNNHSLSELLYGYRNMFVLWTGTMIGTWLSFGLRRPNISFKDLGALEDDMMEPAVRLIFTGTIAITIAFIFVCGMVNVNVGGLNSAHLLAHGSTALLIGMLLGVSEQALPGALTRRASQFVSEVGGKG